VLNVSNFLTSCKDWLAAPEGLCWSMEWVSKWCVGRRYLCIATRLRAGRSGFEFQWGRDISAPDQTDPGTHPSSYTSIRPCSGVKQTGPGVDHLPLSSSHCWNLRGLSRPVVVLLYLHLYLYCYSNVIFMHSILTKTVKILQCSYTKCVLTFTIRSADRFI
jgi:hypothetical protein